MPLALDTHLYTVGSPPLIETTSFIQEKVEFCLSTGPWNIFGTWSVPSKWGVKWGVGLVYFVNKSRKRDRKNGRGQIEGELWSLPPARNP